MPVKYKDLHDPVEDELIRKFREDSRIQGHNRFTIETSADNGPPRTVPILYVLSTFEDAQDITSASKEVTFRFRIEYINNHRDYKRAQEHAKDMFFHLQELLDSTEDDRLLVDENGNRLADGTEALRIVSGDWGHFSDNNNVSWSTAEFEILVDTRDNY